MGFTLDAYFVLDDAALATYGALCPGALASTIACRADEGSEVPVGVALLGPSDLEHELPRADFDSARLEARFNEAGMTRARLPELLESDQLFWTDADYLVAWAMSLMSDRGVTMMRDNTHAGIFIDEYALCWQRGELVFAQGLDYDTGERIQWQTTRNLAYLGNVSESVNPISWALTTMDERFLDYFLFDGYLPRGMGMALYRPTPWTRPLPSISEAQVWAAVSNWVEQHPSS